VKVGLYSQRAALGLIAIYYLLQLLARILNVGILEADEAEQMLYGQWLAAGYPGQPPLYSWLQYVFLQVFGETVLALALLKNLLLFAAASLFFMSAIKLFRDDLRLAWLALLAWAFIPQILWEAQRDLSHSVLVLTMAVAAWYLAVVGLKRVRWWWYPLYGIVLALGLLSKYNFVIFAGALNATLLFTPEGRRLIFDRRLLLTLIAGALVLLPHAWWLIDNAQAGLAGFRKLDMGGEEGRLAGLGAIAVNALGFLTPLWLMALLVFPRVYARLTTPGRDDDAGLHLRAYLLILFSGLVFAVLALGVSSFKDRWFIPLMFMVPIYFFARAQDRDLTRRRVGVFVGVAVTFVGLVLVISATRAVLAPSFGTMTRLNFPFGTFAEQIAARGHAPALIVSDRAWVAGNLHKRFPQSVGLHTGQGIPTGQPQPTGEVLLAWDATRGPDLPERLRVYAEQDLRIDGDDLQPDYLEAPILFNSEAGQVARLGYVVIDHPAAAGVSPER
jgi:4-amino-4-deoxy-L-arabinose transferase-like glycosyltransferase